MRLVNQVINHMNWVLVFGYGCECEILQTSPYSFPHCSRIPHPVYTNDHISLFIFIDTLGMKNRLPTKHTDRRFTLTDPQPFIVTLFMNHVLTPEYEGVFMINQLLTTTKTPVLHHLLIHRLMRITTK